MKKMRHENKEYFGFGGSATRQIVSGFGNQINRLS